MNRKIASAVLATMLATSSTYVLAQPGPPGQQHGNGPSGHPGNGPSGYQDSGPSGHPGNGPSGPPGHGPSRPDHGKGGPPGHPKGGYDRHEAYRPDPPPQRWRKGERVPEPYRGRQYVINDWRPYHLHQPPRGYQWISVGADFFLIGVGSGVVLEAVFGN